MATAERDLRDRLGMMLDTLREVFGSDGEVARALEVDPSQVSRWRRGQQPAELAWDRLIDLFAVASKLEPLYQPSRIRKWIEGVNAHLADRTPLFMIRLGRTDEVLAAIQATKSGAFA
jgi:hypothetical protein